MLEELDSKEIRDRLARLSGSLLLTLHAAEEPDAPLNEPLVEVVSRVAEASGGAIQSRPGDGAGLIARPALVIAHEGRGAIQYMAIPEGAEAAPFVDALLGPKDGNGAAAEWAAPLHGLSRSAELMVFIGATCPHCPNAVTAAVRLAHANERVTVVVVDVQRVPSVTQQFNVRSVPQTVLDRGLAITGVVKERELVERILARDGDDYAQARFVSIVEQGRFEEAAADVCGASASGMLLAAWRRSTTSLRMALMLTVEEVIDKGRAALDPIVVELCALLSSEDAALRGDTADLLGRIGHRDAVEPLTKLLDDPNEDVVDIVKEALEEIEGRED